MPVAAAGAGKFIGGVVGDFASGVNAEGYGMIDRGVAAQVEQYRLADKRLQPYAKKGLAALEDLYAMATGDWDFKADPGYDFRLREGNRSIERAAGAPGGAGRYSGATLKALTQYGQDFASNEYGRAYSRRAGTLLPIAQIGGNAAAGGAGYVAGIGDAYGAGASAKGRMHTDTTSGIFAGIGAGLGAYAGAG